MTFSAAGTAAPYMESHHLGGATYGEPPSWRRNIWRAAILAAHWDTGRLARCESQRKITIVPEGKAV